MSPKHPLRKRVADALLGVLYGALALALVVVAMAFYNQSFTDTTDVTLRTGALGNGLQKGSDVQLNGVPVGRVTGVSADGEGAAVDLSLDPKVAGQLSPDTVARLLPKTLFGERYVMLVPDQGSGLDNGDTIQQDSSDAAVELEQVFDELLPTLRAIQPDKLAASLGELSIALSGQGENLGNSLTTWGNYLERLNPKVPTMTEDFAKFARVTTTYAEAAPDLLDAVNQITTTTNTMVDLQPRLTDLFASVIGSADTSRGWVADNRNTIEVLSSESRRALAAVRPYADQFPCTFTALRKFIPVMDKTLGKGTAEPGVHVRLNIVKSRGKYLPGKDAVKYASGGHSRCPYVSSRVGGGARSGPSALPAPPSQTLARQLGAQVSNLAGLGDANSPAENQFIAELVGPTEGLAPGEYPEWSSLLLGPVLRNAKVTLQ